jgi:hypothetical protein
MTPTTAEGVVARGGGRDGSSTESEGICVGGTIILSFKIERRGVVYGIGPDYGPTLCMVGTY